MNALIIFVKNPELGKVKTRLAKDIGYENALAVYKILLNKTHSISLEANQPTFVFYADKIIENDIWQGINIIKRVQNSDPDLGLRMFAAFNEVFANGYENVIIIGSDNYDITFDFITQGFNCLSKKDAIIGLALDGGYYELGITKNAINKNPELLKNLFLQKQWSHNKVGTEAIEVLNKYNLSFDFLPTLRDIDTKKDLEFYLDMKQFLIK
jgi:uncharacterized protein